MDEAGHLVAKIKSSMVVPFMYKMIHTGALPKFMQKKLNKTDEVKKNNRNLLGGLYRENPVKSRNYEAVKSSKKWENVGNSYIIPALLLYRYSYI